MRSVQVFPVLDAAQVFELLDSLGERSGHEWFEILDHRVEVSVAAYVSVEHLVEGLAREGSYDEESLRVLRSASPELSGVHVDLRVSGRVDGQAEMRAMTRRLLVAGGRAMDDYSDHVWTLEEIEQDLPTGERFRA